MCASGCLNGYSRGNQGPAASRQVKLQVGDELGRLDGVIDIVGLARYKALIDLTDDDWQFHLGIVLRHVYLAVEYAARYWQRTGTGGALAVVASVAGLQSSPKRFPASGSPST